MQAKASRGDNARAAVRKANIAQLEEHRRNPTNKEFDMNAPDR